jgi:hypothetical protein
MGSHLNMRHVADAIRTAGLERASCESNQRGHIEATDAIAFRFLTQVRSGLRASIRRGGN